MLFDEHHFNEASLEAAWRNATNQSIAASIIGNIRQAALAEALLPFERRVAQAIQRIYVMHSWTPVQRRWLECLAKQLTLAKDGGAAQLDKLLGQQLPQVLETLAASLWPQVA